MLSRSLYFCNGKNPDQALKTTFKQIKQSKINAAIEGDLKQQKHSKRTKIEKKRSYKFDF